MSRFFVLLFSVFVSVAAHAEFSIAPFISLGNSLTDDGATKTTSSSTGMDLHLGYTLDIGLYLGVVYDTYTSKAKSEPSGGGSTTTVNTQFTAFGPGIGYKNGGFFIFAHYLANPRIERESGSTTVFSGGTGTQFDIGYAFQLAEFFRLGLDYRYISYTIKKAEASGTTTDLDVRNDNGSILAAMFFEF